MPNQLEFMDCPTCGKRMVTTAPICRHCKQSPDFPAPERHIANQANSQAVIEDFDEDEDVHHASTAGYDSDEDDFDYEEFVAQEFPEESKSPHLRVPGWIWVTAWLLIAAMILPFFLAFL